MLEESPALLQFTRCGKGRDRIRWSAGGIIRSRFKNNGGSYLSSHDPREILGIGKAERIDWIEINWPKPSNRIQRLQNPKLDRYMTVREL